MEQSIKKVEGIPMITKLLMPLPFPIHASKKTKPILRAAPMPMTKGHLTHTDGLYTGRSSGQLTNVKLMISNGLHTTQSALHNPPVAFKENGSIG
jgi:hypothetical protein